MTEAHERWNSFKTTSLDLVPIVLPQKRKKMSMNLLLRFIPTSFLEFLLVFYYINTTLSFQKSWDHLL